MNNLRFKAFLAENRIYALKKMWNRNNNYRIERNLRSIPMYQTLDTLTENLNKRFLTFEGKVIDYKPADIDETNVGEFVEYLNSIDPLRTTDIYQFDDDDFNYKFNINQKVKLRLKSSSLVPKRSDSPFFDTTYIITNRFLYLARNKELSEGYLIRPFNPKRRKLADIRTSTFVVPRDLVSYED